MKKSRILSLLLAVVMVAATVPALGLTAAATGDATASYVVYEQDFESLTVGATGDALLGELGWYIPDAKKDSNNATYSIVGNTTNKSFRVNTLSGSNLEESFVTIFGGDIMSILREASFTLSYRLTYNAATTNNDGYASLIYNYNEMHGTVVNGEGNEVYGIAAVRMSGTGMNAVYYPVAYEYGSVNATVVRFHSLEREQGNPQVMANRYDTTGVGASLYSVLTGTQESADTTLQGSNVFANKPLDISVTYDKNNGVFVDINGIRVSDMNTTDEYNSQIANSQLWSDFITRNDGAAIALLAQPGIVADIDNISITSDSIDSTAADQEMPALLITEVCGYPTTSHYEYVEIYNPNDYAVDVANYSLIYTKTAENGSAIDSVRIRDRGKNGADRMKSTYLSYVNLGDMFGTEQIMTSAQYLDINKASSYKNMFDHYELDENGDPYTYVNENGTYRKATDGETGAYYYVLYKDMWNTRYQQGSSDYATNTMLNPGECMVLYLTLPTTVASYTTGVNHGDLTTTFATSGFRAACQSYGLTEDVKVLNVQGINIENNANCMLYIGQAVDENGKEIDYTTRQITDLSNIESYVQYSFPIIHGLRQEGTDYTSTTFGQSARTQQDYVGVYVYGVDASSDYRFGTIYEGRSPVFVSKTKKYAHIGALAGYQEILLGSFYQQAQSQPELMITEIMPHTNDLQGNDSNAFTAIELTNTSSYSIDLYNYALVRTETGLDCLTGQGFSRAVALRSGNPVNRVDGNGAYYYFAEDNIKNPDTCTLAPGETVVVWFLNGDTYASYYTDEDFGFSYFRQYWVNQGCSELALKNSDGDYVVKVIAADGCENESYNAANASVSFMPCSTAAAVYGVAVATPDVLSGVIKTTDVKSVAYLGLSSTYFELNPTTVTTADGATTYLVQELKYSEIPVNMGMRYVVNDSFSCRISSMIDTLKINDHLNGGSTYQYYYDVSTLEEGASVVFRGAYQPSSVALKTAGLGTLDGKEALCLKDQYFRAVTDSNGNTVYKYFDKTYTGITTLSGAALSPDSTTAELRFDHVVEKDLYSTLVATYGIANVKVGTIVVMSADLQDGVAFTKEAFDQAGIKYADAPAKLLYYSNGYAVLGSTVTVNDKNHETYYTAIGYLEVTVNGTVYTFTSATSTERSVSAVASAALRDTAVNQGGIYQNLVDGKYSPYTAAQIAQYKIFAGE